MVADISGWAEPVEFAGVIRDPIVGEQVRHAGVSKIKSSFFEALLFEGDRNRMNIYLGGVLWVGVAAALVAAAAYLIALFDAAGSADQTSYRPRSPVGGGAGTVAAQRSRRA